MKLIARQGDVAIFAVDSTPDNVGAEVPRDNGRIVLAYGEVTGHAHAIADREATLHALPDTADRFLRIMASSGVALRHEEHSTVTIPAGNYVVRRQVEYVPKALPRQVAD